MLSAVILPELGYFLSLTIQLLTKSTGLRVLVFHFSFVFGNRFLGFFRIQMQTFLLSFLTFFRNSVKRKEWSVPEGAADHHEHEEEGGENGCC